DSERRRLARLGKADRRKALGQLACITSPDTILRWYRELVARKYDGSKKRGAGPTTGRTTIKRLLKEHGIDPSPIRGRGMPWATFIKAQLAAITAADFFTVEVVSMAGLVRYHVLFLIDVASRKVEIGGITSSPSGAWMEQVARNLLDAEDGFLKGKRYLLVDRDTLYTNEFRSTLG